MPSPLPTIFATSIPRATCKSASTSVYRQRISGFAVAMTSTPNLRSAPALQKYDPAWAAAAGRYLGRLQAALGAGDRCSLTAVLGHVAG